MSERTPGPCHECRHWYAILAETDGTRLIGQCRARAPVLTETAPGMRAQWPETLPDDWCSEFHEREQCS